MWGTLSDGDNIVWGTVRTTATTSSGARSAGDDNIVWGTDCGGANCDNIVWGTSVHGLATTSSGAPPSVADNIVWGTSGEVDNIVWGTSAEDDGTTWGSSGDEAPPLFEDPDAGRPTSIRPCSTPCSLRNRSSQRAPFLASREASNGEDAFRDLRR